MNIRDYLVDNGITQQDCADTIGVSRAHLSLVITGQRKAGRRIAAKIEQFTDGAIKADDILNGVSTGYQGAAKRAAPKSMNKALMEKDSFSLL